MVHSYPQMGQLPPDPPRRTGTGSLQGGRGDLLSQSPPIRRRGQALGGFARHILFFFLLAKTHRGGQDAKPQRNSGRPTAGRLTEKENYPFFAACPAELRGDLFFFFFIHARSRRRKTLLTKAATDSKRFCQLLTRLNFGTTYTRSRGFI